MYKTRGFIRLFPFMCKIHSDHIPSRDPLLPSLPVSPVPASSLTSSFNVHVFFSVLHIKGKHMTLTSLNLLYFTWHEELQLYLFSHKPHGLIPLCGSIAHCVYMPKFPYVYSWVPMLMPQFGCCDKHGNTSVYLCTNFDSCRHIYSTVVQFDDRVVLYIFMLHLLIVCVWLCVYLCTHVHV